MEFAIVCVLLFLGLVFIIKGGDYFVDSAAWIAETLGLPQFIIGATVVSLATTLPEVIVSVIAAAEGHAFLIAGDAIAAAGQVEMSIGNAVGSVTANTGLIMGIALLFAPCTMPRKQFVLKGALLILLIATLLAFCYSGVIKLWMGLILLIPLVVFIVDNVLTTKKTMVANVSVTGGGSSAKIRRRPRAKETVFNLFRFSVGVFGIVLGARLLVDNGTALAKLLNIPEGIIAVTIVAVGTSLPELVTMVTAIVKKRGSMSLGNIIGANIIDTALILPLCVLVYGAELPVARVSLILDLPFCLGIVAVALIPSMFTKKFTRWQGAVMLALYATYLALRITFVGV